ncbi:MAG TPA: tRNA uridine-5-carboxymethylaminomethyl(34) synthesis GTPase MnmE, partial [Candidatus Omnitrophota bacterium]|nr:tRNA uridine-5-carboxymethylaminomethyl(34) synthesis GTPase MnmE [Candidatus Omnitrophota bacterium]
VSFWGIGGDLMEKEGVRRSREKISRSDLVIFMLDGTRSLSQEDMDIYELVKDKKKIVVVNKVDLAQQIEIDSIMEKFGVNGIISASVAKEIGISEIEDAIVEKVMEGGVSLPEGPVITNLRHKEALEEALRSVENAMNVTGKNYNGELLASDLNNAVRALGLITGETVSEDVLDRIFSQFCIGK